MELCRYSISFMATVLLRSAIDVKPKKGIRDRASRRDDIVSPVLALGAFIWLCLIPFCRTGGGGGHCPFSVSNLNTSSISN